MDDNQKLQNQLILDFSKSLWNSANTLTLGIYGLAFAVYGIVFASSQREAIFDIVKEQYFWIFLFAIIGNSLIIYGLIAIRDMHQKHLQKYSGDETLMELVPRAIRFRIIAVVANWAMYMGIVALIAFGD